MQVKIKTPVAKWASDLMRHGFSGLPFTRTRNWQRLAPARVEVRRALRADQHIGVDVLIF